MISLTIRVMAAAVMVSMAEKKSPSATVTLSHLGKRKSCCMPFTNGFMSSAISQAKINGYSSGTIT